MSLPSREVAAGWVDLPVVDAAGTEIGRCLRIYADLDTGKPEWLVVDRDGAERVLPLIDAGEADGRITVSFTAEVISAAPEAAGRDGLSTEEEVVFYAHYGVPVGSDRSDSLLPAAESGESAVDDADTAVETPSTPVSAADDKHTAEALPATDDAPRTDMSAPDETAPDEAAPDEVASATPHPATPHPATPHPAPAAVPAYEPDHSAVGAGMARRLLAVTGVGAAAVTAYAASQRSGRPAGRIVPRVNTRALRAATASAAKAATVRRPGLSALPRPTAGKQVAALRRASRASTRGVAAGQQALPLSLRAIQRAGRTVGGLPAGVILRLAGLGGAGRRAAGGSADVASSAVRRTATTAKAARPPRRRTVQRTNAVRTAFNSAATVAAQRTQHIQRKGSRLMGKLTTGLALGAGYVLGARAGRERYEVIKRVSTQVAQRPEVQQVSDKVKTAVNDKLATNGPARKLGYPEHERWRALRPTGATESTGLGNSGFATPMPASDPLLAPPVEPLDAFDADLPPVIDVTADEAPHDRF